MKNIQKMWKNVLPTLNSHTVGKVIITSTPSSNGRIYSKELFLKHVEDLKTRIKHEQRIKKLNRIINGRI